MQGIKLYIGALECSDNIHFLLIDVCDESKRILSIEVSLHYEHNLLFYVEHALRSVIAIEVDNELHFGIIRNVHVNQSQGNMAIRI